MREIDITAGPLTADEIGWLTQRERFDLIEQNAALFPEDADEFESVEDKGAGEPDDNYDEWQAKDLKAEAEKRSIDIAGMTKKVQVIAALRAWDKANAE